MHDEIKHKTDYHCQDLNCPSGKRNRYFKGKNMTADDFVLEQNYSIERRRLINRAIHGWGVVYGFKLELVKGESGANTGILKCSEGLALDKHGRELVRTKTEELHTHKIILLESLKGSNSGEERYSCLLQAHYAERQIDELRIAGGCGCGEQEWNHVCETLVFSLVPLNVEKGCPCGETSCQTCNCLDDPICARGDGQNLDECDAIAPIDRGPHNCLCQWVTNRKNDLPTQSDVLQCLQGFEGYRIAIDDPVPLACITITIDQCGHPKFELIDDACKPRTLVKNNDLLFDLIRGCDLTHIIETSWAEWHRKLTREEAMPWSTFVNMIAPSTSDCDGDKKQVIRTDFRIRFSAPVEINTLRPDCIVMTVFAAEDVGGWIEERRVPITRLESSINKNCPDGFTDEVYICVNYGWCDDEIFGHKSIFHRPKVRVEIEVCGDLILDCHGQAIDVNAVGVRPVPTGNGTPGGTYLSTFRVSPKRAPEREAKIED